MTTKDDIAQLRPSGLMALAAAVALAANSFVVVVVNWYIYWARSRFIATHPAYVAEQPPTISRAISDPIIGEPFAFWVTLSAGVLYVGVAILAISIWLASRHLGAEFASTGKRMRQGSVAVLILQVGGSVGMVMLSQFRSPDHGDLHMVGSYLFFFSQAFVVVTGTMIAACIRRDEAAHGALDETGWVHLPANALRRLVGFLSIFLAAAYLVLFVLKGFTFPVGNDAIYVVYVSTEPAVISAFLMFVLLFHADLLLVLRRYSAATVPEVQIARAKTPAE